MTKKKGYKRYSPEFKREALLRAGGRPYRGFRSAFPKKKGPEGPLSRSACAPHD